MLTKNSAGSDEVKLEALLLHLEECLDLESFHIAQRNTTALLESIPRSTEITFAVCDLLRFGSPERLRAKIEQIEAIGQKNLLAVANLMSEMRSEINEIVGLGARLKQLRRGSQMLSTEQPALRICRWA